MKQDEWDRWERTLLQRRFIYITENKINPRSLFLSGVSFLSSADEQCLCGGSASESRDPIAVFALVQSRDPLGLSENFSLAGFFFSFLF